MYSIIKDTPKKGYKGTIPEWGVNFLSQGVDIYKKMAQQTQLKLNCQIYNKGKCMETKKAISHTFLIRRWPSKHN